MLLYRSLFILLTPLILLHLVYKALQRGGWRYFADRIGIGYRDLEDSGLEGCTWFHCASVGEVRAVLPLIEKLHETRPEQPILITSNTPTSREVVLRYDRPWLVHAYSPIDWMNATRMFLATARPARCILFETEIWPNLISECESDGIPVTIINGRISDSSMRRASWLRLLYAGALARVSHVYTRSDEDRRRYIELGSDESRTETVGDIKLSGAHRQTAQRQSVTERDYVLIVSTHGDEERHIMDHCSDTLAGRLAVIAPRHPERGASVASQLHRLGLDIAVYSRQDPVNDDTRVLILDAIGLLDEWYPGATVVVMGGSFTGIGGHNIIEPLAWDRAVIYGPDMHNFVEADAAARHADACIQVDDYAGLDAALKRLLADDGERKRLEANAAALMEKLSSTLPAYLEKLT